MPIVSIDNTLGPLGPTIVIIVDMGEGRVEEIPVTNEGIHLPNRVVPWGYLIEALLDEGVGV